MVVTISGAGGFIGRNLVRELNLQGHVVRAIRREDYDLPDTGFQERVMAGSDVVVNLAGSPVSRRWTPVVKQEIYDSRIRITRKIGDAIRQMPVKPALLISGSAIGIYADHGRHNEYSTRWGTGFLSGVCQEWEAEALSVSGLTRVAVIRTGIVLGDGGMMKKVLPLFSAGLGGRIGHGRQPFSFIHMKDLTGLILAVIGNPEMKGVYNGVSPEPVTNLQFTQTLARIMKRPALMTVPAFALKLLYGEGASVLSGGQEVVPDRVLESGFRFAFPALKEALEDLLSS